VTSDGGHRLGLEPSTPRVRRGACVRFANPTRAFVTVRIGAGYAVDLPSGTLTGPPGRADCQARHAGVRVDAVTAVSPISTLPSGTGTITVVAPEPSCVAVRVAPQTPLASPTPLADRFVQV
jgi:hypothetical protein